MRREQVNRYFWGERVEKCQFCGAEVVWNEGVVINAKGEGEVHSCPIVEDAATQDNDHA